MADSDFDSWLNIKLKALNIDEGIYGSYIKGILEGDESVEDKTEALEGILSELTSDDLPSHCKEILENWQKVIQSLNKETNNTKTEDVDVKIARLMESQAKSTTVAKIYTEEEKKIREAILAQYSQMSDDEETGDNEKTNTAENGLEKNTNAAVVAQAEREKRDKAKLESQKKKEKDKEDREKQKQQQAEKKEKRKTQKGERRR